jgi:hypothetical protein
LKPTKKLKHWKLLKKINNMKTAKLTCCIILQLCAFTAAAQQSLKQKLAGKNNLKEIMQIVTSHLADEEKQNKNNPLEQQEVEKEIYFWQRWAKQNEHRVDGNGNLYYNTDSIISSNFETYKNAHAAEINAPLNVQSNTGSWISMGPHDVTYTSTSNSDGLGRINCIAFHPTDANTMLAGSPQSGIWKTTNGGNFWYNLNDGLTNTGIGGLCYDRTNSNIIIAVTGDGDGSYGIFGQWVQNSIGILKSNDGGKNWTKVHTFGSGSGQSVIFGFKLFQHPNNNNLFFAATSQGIFRSTNGGNSWTNVQAGNFTDIEVKPDGTGAVMYATCFANGGPYFFRSTNTGENWSSVAIPQIAGNVRSAIAVTAANNSSVYLLAGCDRNINLASINGYYQGVFKSTDNGQTFTQVCTTPNILNGNTSGAGNGDQSNYDLAVTVNPANEQEVITGGVIIWRSTNGNSNPMTFSNATTWIHNVANNNINYVHADVHELAYNPLNNNLYACTDGGVSVSSNNGVTWITISSNMHITAGVYADWLEADPNIIAAGTQDNGTVFRHAASNNYKTIGGGDGGDVLINQTNVNDIIFAATGNILRTTSPGINQTLINPAVPTWLNNFYPILARNYSDDNNIFAGGALKLYRSTNRGASWDSCSGTINCTSILTTCRSNTLVIYTGNTGALYRSDDGGATLNLISNGTGFNPFNMPIADVEATHAVSGFIYACLGGYTNGQKVFYSTNAGVSWTNVSGSLPNVACHSIILDAANNVYVGTDIGVFVRPVGQTDWRPYFNGLPRTPVQDLMINQTFNRIIAVSFGHGNFFTDLYAPVCPPSQNITGLVSGNQFIEAGSITADATIEGGLGTSVAVSGTTDVYLLPGFNVAETNSFRAYNAPCGATGVPLKAGTAAEPIPVTNIVLKAGKNKPFPDGHINGLPDNTYRIFYEGPGDYTIRITDLAGTVTAPLTTKQITTAAAPEIFNPAQFKLPAGTYYIQLLKNNTLVHFLEYNHKNADH